MKICFWKFKNENFGLKFEVLQEHTQELLMRLVIVLLRSLSDSSVFHHVLEFLSLYVCVLDKNTKNTKKTRASDLSMCVCVLYQNTKNID